MANLKKADVKTLTCIDRAISEAFDALDALANEIEESANDARDKFDSASERYQESDKGLERSAKIEELAGIAAALVEARDSLESVQSEIQNILMAEKES